MSNEQRTGRRVPIACPARIRSRRPEEPAAYGTCTELSVGGMTLQTSFVPLPDEKFEVTIRPPRGPGLTSPPMRALVQVRRCHVLETDRLYELGVQIVHILS